MKILKDEDLDDSGLMAIAIDALEVAYARLCLALFPRGLRQ
ncbi:hypothetical protein [Rhizobium lentis]